MKTMIESSPLKWALSFNPFSVRDMSPAAAADYLMKSQRGHIGFRIERLFQLLNDLALLQQ
jgi:hypothetical protein